MQPAAAMYYVPGAAGRGLSGLPTYLQSRLAEGHTRLSGASGPDGGRGLLATWQQGVALSYDPATQSWHRCGDHWRGFRNDMVPAELAKPLLTPAEGWRVTLGDGRQYVIPVALADAPNFGLPWRDTLASDGTMAREIAPDYARLCALAGRVWDQIQECGRLEIDDDELREACVSALAVNYRLDLQDCLALGLFTSETYQAIVRAFLDLPALEAMLKKKRPAGSGMTSGLQADCETMPPPGQILGYLPPNDEEPAE